MAFSASFMNRLSAASAALTDRPRARFTSERLSAQDEEQGVVVDNNNNGMNNIMTELSSSPIAEEDRAALVTEESLTTSTTTTTERPLTMTPRSNAEEDSVPPLGERSDTEEEEDDDFEDEHNDDANNESNEILEGNDSDMYNFRTTMTLAELQEERELARRRMSACVMLTVFILFKLWIDCIEQPSLPLLMVCLIGTSWTARWIRYNREREEELDRRIAQYLQANQTEAETGGNGVMDRNDLRMLSFQAQLALAIMESQRHMMEGGRPDEENQTPGVSDAAKEHWEQISFHDSTQYGSVKDVDGPHCSICLCEYEEGDKLAKLPCQHLYHNECIESWTSNHTKCPLCNFELESVADEPATAAENIV